MKKFEGILLASDLDGTLLCDDKSVSKENLEAIEYFKKEGGTFIFVTGRLPSNARNVADIVKPNGACGCLNGAGIYDYGKNKYLWNTCISRDVLSIVDYIYENHPEIGIELNCLERIYFIRKNASIMKHIKNESLPDINAHHREVTEPVVKVLLASEITRLEKVVEIIRKLPGADNYDIFRTDEEYYEILPKNIHKGVALGKLKELFPEIKKTVAVGDNDNDEQLLLAADFSVAVANAKEKTKKAADVITVSNNESAIAEIIHTLI